VLAPPVRLVSNFIAGYSRLSVSARLRKEIR
jgi:hypothetical protein